MTTNTETVKNYKSVDEVNGGVKNGAGVELRNKRKESFAKRQQSFQRQNSCGVEIDRPLTRWQIIILFVSILYFLFCREDLRKSFGRSNTISSASADNDQQGEEKAEGSQVRIDFKNWFKCFLWCNSKELEVWKWWDLFLCITWPQQIFKK